MNTPEDFIVGHLSEGDTVSTTEMIQELTKKPHVRALGVVSGDDHEQQRHIYAHFESTSRNYLTTLKTRNSLRATMRKVGANVVELPVPEAPTGHSPPRVRGRQLKLHIPNSPIPIPGGDGGGGGAA